MAYLSRKWFHSRNAIRHIWWGCLTSCCFSFSSDPACRSMWIVRASPYPLSHHHSPKHWSCEYGARGKFGFANLHPVPADRSWQVFDYFLTINREVCSRSSGVGKELNYCGRRSNWFGAQNLASEKLCTCFPDTLYSSTFLWLLSVSLTHKLKPVISLHSYIRWSDSQHQPGSELQPFCLRVYWRSTAIQLCKRIYTTGCCS